MLARVVAMQGGRGEGGRGMVSRVLKSTSLDCHPISVYDTEVHVRAKTITSVCCARGETFPLPLPPSRKLLLMLCEILPQWNTRCIRWCEIVPMAE